MDEEVTAAVASISLFRIAQNEQRTGVIAVLLT